MKYPEVRISGDRARVVYGRGEFLDVDVEALAQMIAESSDRGSRSGLLPSGVRLLLERGEAAAFGIELPPHARTVRWIRDDSPEPYGPGATYDEHWISFPYILLLVLFRGNQLTGLQQLFYRNRPLDVDEDLYLPNLPNVANSGALPCWICLQNLGRVGRRAATRRTGIRPTVSQIIDAIGNHVLAGANNRSSEENEGNSLWSAMRGLDPRLETVETWAAATKADPLFVTRIPWRPAGTTLTKELGRMLDLVAPPRRIRTGTDLAGLVSVARGRARTAG